MCKYCENESGYVEQLYDVAHGDFGDIGLYGDSRQVCVGTEAFGKEFSCTFRINFCPMCGRNLNKESEE